MGFISSIGLFDFYYFFVVNKDVLGRVGERSGVTLIFYIVNLLFLTVGHILLVRFLLSLSLGDFVLY